MWYLKKELVKKIVWEKSVLLEIVDEFLFGIETSCEDSAKKDITNFYGLIQIF